MSYFKKVKKEEPVDNNLENPVWLAEFLNADIKFKSCHLLKFQSFKSSELTAFHTPKRLLVASNNRLQYIGSNYESVTSKITSSVLKVAVYKKTTQQIKLYNVDFFRLKPLLKCQVSVKGSTEETWKEKSENLSLAFGSKTKVKAIASRLRYETAASESISSSTLNESCALEEKTSATVKQEPEAIPTQNKNATSVNEVYDIYEIISKEDYNALDSEVGVFVSATNAEIQLWKNDDRYCHFIIHYLQARCQSLTVHSAKLLCYFHYMMCFLKTTYQEWRKKDPVPEVPQPFKKSLMKRYVLQRAMPQRMKDKLLAEALVLALTISNYMVDGKSLAMSTQISMQRLVLIAYALGCHVSQQRNQDAKLIQLKLPLYKYEPRSFKRK